MAEPDYDLIKAPGWGEEDGDSTICDDYFSDYYVSKFTVIKDGMMWVVASFELKYVKAFPNLKRIAYCPNSSKIIHKNIKTNVEQTLGIDSNILAIDYGGDGAFHEFSQDTGTKTWCLVNGKENGVSGTEDGKGLKIDDIYNVGTAETITCASKEYPSYIFVGKGEITISSDTYSVEDYYNIKADTSVNIEASSNSSFIRFSEH